jgi:hypothetical protein
MLESFSQIIFLLCLLAMFEWTVDILMDTNCVSFPADYSFVSVKRTIVKMVTLVVEAILANFLSREMSLKSFFLCLQNRP